jgi:hypothetical protein
MLGSMAYLSFDAKHLRFIFTLCAKPQSCMMTMSDAAVWCIQIAGLGVIDFEAWRPIWRQNWASLLPYRDLSRKLEKQRHPVWWTPEQIEAEVTGHFASSGSDMCSVVRRCCFL